MTTADKQLLHAALLQALRAVGDRGRGEHLLLTDSRMAGFESLTLPQLQLELRALADKRWVVPFSPPLGGQRYRITDFGASQLEEQGL